MIIVFLKNRYWCLWTRSVFRCLHMIIDVMSGPILEESGHIYYRRKAKEMDLIKRRVAQLNPCREDAAPLMLGVHTAFGSLLLGWNSFRTNGCPGKKALVSSSSPSIISASHLHMSDAKPQTRNRFSQTDTANVIVIDELGSVQIIREPHTSIE